MVFSFYKAKKIAYISGSEFFHFYAMTVLCECSSTSIPVQLKEKFFIRLSTYSLRAEPYFTKNFQNQKTGGGYFMNINWS